MELSTLLDTNVVLYALQDRLDEGLPDAEVFLSVISEIELLSFPGLSVEESQKIAALLSQMTIVDLDEPVKTMAISLRRDEGAHNDPGTCQASFWQKLNASLAANFRADYEPHGCYKRNRLAQETRA